MSTPATEERRLRCLKCGFTAPVGDDWGRIDSHGIGTLTQCPDCGSTDVQERR